MPELLPDELLFSFLGRMGALNALGNTRERMHLLFGAKNVLPVTDLPTRLEYLQAAIGSLSPWRSALELINQATLYPYHRPFLTIERHAAVESIMRGASGKSLKTLLGRVANRFGAAPVLRFCPTCSTEDIGRYGAPYWHCSHQLPGVTVCPIHRTNLLSYLKSFHRSDRQRIVLAPGIYQAEYPSTEPCAQQIAFASLSSELFAARLPVLDGPTYQCIYREAIFNLGFRRRRYIDYLGLATAVRAHYKDFEGFPHRERLLSTQHSPLSWLRTLVERPQRSAHPICHLLLIGFLFKTVEFFNRMASSKPKMGANPSTTAFPDDSFAQSLNDDEILRNLGLSCREVARLTNRSVTTVVTKRRVLGLQISERPKSRRPELLSQIGFLIEQGISPQQIADDCNTSLSTVYRIRVQFAELEQRGKFRWFDNEREERRRQWMKVLDAGKGIGITAVRKTSSATYAWLYRNDREWLRHVSADFKVHRVPRVQVDWPSRDDKFCSLVSAFVEQLRCRSVRPRISRSLMIQQVGDTSVRANIQRLPKLKLLMDELEETSFAYQCVRIKRAAQSLAAVGQPVVNWRLQRIAGVRTWTTKHSQFVSRVVVTNNDEQDNNE